MGFDQRPPTSGGISPISSPNLPIADSSQGHDIPTGVAPSLAKLQDWIAWLLANGVLYLDPIGAPGLIANDITIGGDLTVTGTADIAGAVSMGSSAAVGTDLTVGDDLTVTDDASVGGTLTVLTGIDVTGPVNVTGSIDASGSVDAAEYVTVSGTQPASSADPGANRLHGTNMVKAWGVVSINNGVFTVLDGYNIASVSLNGISDFTADVVFARAMANANYAITYGVGGADGSRRYANTSGANKSASGFGIQIQDEQASANVDLTSTGGTIEVSICVMGRQ